MRSLSTAETIIGKVDSYETRNVSHTEHCLPLSFTENLLSAKNLHTLAHLLFTTQKAVMIVSILQKYKLNLRKST